MGTRAVVKYRVCDKCTRERDATITHRLTLDGYAYELDLCDEHSAKLYGQVMAWADSGTKVAEPSMFDKPRRATRAVIAVPREERPATKTPTPVETAAAHWHITEHARQRAEQRGVPVDELLLAAHYPEHVEPSSVTLGASLRTRGDCTAVVIENRVMTAYRPSTSDNQEEVQV